LEYPVDEIKGKGKDPNLVRIMGLDLKNGRVMKNEEINDYLKARPDYNGWLNENMNYLQEYIDSPNLQIEDIDNRELEEKQRYFNITHEVIDQIIEPMLKDGKEATGSMGDDTPLAVFSKIQRNFLPTFFKPRNFAPGYQPHPIRPRFRRRKVCNEPLNTGPLERLEIS